MLICVYLIELYHSGYNHPYGPLVSAIGADDDVTKLAAWHRVTRTSQYFWFLYDSGSHRTLSSEVRRPIIPGRPFVGMALICTSLSHLDDCVCLKQSLLGGLRHLY